MTDIEVSLEDVSFETPLLLASGVLDQTADSMKRMLDKGLGGVVTKSIGKKAREGHPNPTMVELETGLLNAMGLPNPGIDTFKEELKDLNARTDKPVITSIYGKDPEEFSDLAKKMEENGASAVELNMSCPHAKRYGASIGSDLKMVKEVVKRVKEDTDIPAIAKLPPGSEIAKTARAAEEAGADCLVATNTVKAMAIDLEAERPILGNKVGGYSGPGIKPISLRCVYEVYEEVDIPIIGCGGINHGRDALEFVLAGATALQVGSAIHYRGKEAPEKIKEEMESLMEQEDIGGLAELRGKAHS